ncbi:MAG TPA: GAF domain-containing protein [Candidatus Sulfomarinibacteraceae bacterium]|nr:GAF domain-containing protein [Candidatus Sulfomarinibacteraceae bacterium]
MSEQESNRRTWRPGATLRGRLVLNTGIIALLLAVAVGLVALQIRSLIVAVNDYQVTRSYLDAAITVRHQSTELYASVSRHLLDRDAQQFADGVSRELYDVTESQRHLREVIAESENPELQARFDTVDEYVTNVINIATTMVRQAEAGQWENVQVRAALLNRDQGLVNDAVNVLVFAVRQVETEAFNRVAEAQETIILYATVFIPIAVVFAALLFTRLVSTINRPIQQLTQGASELAAGNLQSRVNIESEDELGQLAEAFNHMADELRVYYRELEERVAERTRALHTSLDVSRRLSTILNRTELTHAVVEQVREAFDYYHVHIYLFDDRRQHLLMVGGTGEAGQAMLARGHRLEVGQGLVGSVAQHNEVRLVPDVSQDPNWLPNPLLPHTKAEIAVPITFGEEVQGVLDVQHDEVGGLDDNDASLLQVIAAQVAVALQNARLLEQAEARAERAGQVNAINQRIQNASSVEAVLQIAAQELGRALGVPRAHVELQAPGAEASQTGPARDAPPASTGNGANGSPDRTQ